MFRNNYLTSSVPSLMASSWKLLLKSNSSTLTLFTSISLKIWKRAQYSVGYSTVHTTLAGAGYTYCTVSSSSKLLLIQAYSTFITELLVSIVFGSTTSTIGSDKTKCFIHDILIPKSSLTMSSFFCPNHAIVITLTY